MQRNHDSHSWRRILIRSTITNKQTLISSLLFSFQCNGSIQHQNDILYWFLRRWFYAGSFSIWCLGCTCTWLVVVPYRWWHLNITFIYTGRDGERVPRHITHVRMGKALKFVRASAFERASKHRRNDLSRWRRKKLKSWHSKCPSLRRVIIPGVTEVGKSAFGIVKPWLTLRERKIGNDWSSGIYVHIFEQLDFSSIEIIEYSAFIGCRRITITKTWYELGINQR